MNASMIEIIVPAVPVAEPRKRTRVVGKFAMHYTPEDSPVNAFKATVRLATAQAMSDRSSFTGGVEIELLFAMPRNAGQMWKNKPMPRLLHTKKPDSDNLAKSVLDALKGLLWLDDAQVCSLRIVKVICAGDERPFVRIRAWELANCPGS